MGENVTSCWKTSKIATTESQNRLLKVTCQNVETEITWQLTPSKQNVYQISENVIVTLYISFTNNLLFVYKLTKLLRK